jgi:segregation and condensation protein B
MPAGGGSASTLPMGLRSPYLARPTVKPRAATGGSGVRDPRMARVEAVLFLADEPLNTRKISQLANLADGTEARTLIRRLNDFYDRQGTAFRAEETAGGYQLLTRRKFSGWLRRLVRTHVETRLSAPALETLAVAAYRQPVTRLEIESIRGVACDEMLRQLMDRDLVKIVGRSDDLGRPFLYGTTKRFLRFFGLRHLDDLPRAAELRATGSTADSAGAPDKSQADLSLVNDSIEEPEVKVSTKTGLTRDDEEKRRHPSWLEEVRAVDEDDDDDLDDDEEDDDDDDDEEDDDDDEEEDDEDFDDDDFDDDWEEVDEDDEDEDEEDDDWDDDDEDDDDDDDDEEDDDEDDDDE